MGEAYLICVDLRSSAANIAWLGRRVDFKKTESAADERRSTQIKQVRVCPGFRCRANLLTKNEIDNFRRKQQRKRI
jgi:hypothetical protein